MKLVIDANILFAALIKPGLTAELIVSDELQLFAPEFLLEEFGKYEKIIIEKTHRAEKDFKIFLELLKEYINIISQKEILPYLDQVNDFTPDPKDSVYLALALAINSKIWSNDRKLKEEQDRIEVLTTEDLISKIGSIKKK